MQSIARSAAEVYPAAVNAITGFEMMDEKSGGFVVEMSRRNGDTVDQLIHRLRFCMEMTAAEYPDGGCAHALPELDSDDFRKYLLARVWGAL